MLPRFSVNILISLLLTLPSRRVRLGLRCTLADPYLLRISSLISPLSGNPFSWPSYPVHPYRPYIPSLQSPYSCTPSLIFFICFLFPVLALLHYVIPITVPPIPSSVSSLHPIPTIASLSWSDLFQIRSPSSLCLLPFSLFPFITLTLLLPYPPSAIPLHPSPTTPLIISTHRSCHIISFLSRLHHPFPSCHVHFALPSCP